MLMPASPEFIAICRAQIAVLTQGLGAALSVVYLTEGGSGEELDLTPVVAYPEGVASWEREQILAFLAKGRGVGDGQSRWQFPSGSLPEATLRSPQLPAAGGRSPQESASTPDPHSPMLDNPLAYPQPVMMPLVHEGVMMGLLVTARADRPWMTVETAQIERVARTLAMACVLDQRAQWAEHDLRQQRRLQAYQNEAFDDLLHQFRNPLTALRTFGKLLIKRLRPTDPQQADPNYSAAEGIVRESDRLQDLLRRFEEVIDWGEADLINHTVEAQSRWEGTQSEPPSTQQSSLPALPSASKILTGTQLTLAPYPYQALVEPLLDSARAIAQDRQITLQVNIPPSLPPVIADRKALQEVWSNLIDNALKYTPAGGTVTLIGGIHQEHNHVPLQGLCIVDNGPGIPASDLPQLFQRHYRGVQAHGEIPGTGLGLAIARDLVQQMNGEIQVFSPASQSGLAEASADHPGTAFIVWLPEAEHDVA